MSGPWRRLAGWPTRLVDAVWPRDCQICGEAAPDSPDCCAVCRAELPWLVAACRRCGLPLPRSVDLCGACVRRPPPFDQLQAALHYAPPVSHLVQRFKFGGDLAAGRLLAELLADALIARQVRRPQLMIPVPLNWRRWWRRGFNQAEWLSRDLGRHLGGLPQARALRRHRATAAQSSLPARRRRGNVRGAFVLAGLPPGTRHVALIDDVATTGATLAECARVLKRAGVAQVDAWVVARA